MLAKELEELIEEIQTANSESQTIEVKSAHDGCPTRLYDTLSSFSNQDEGGIIVFGLDENSDFEAVGVYDSQDLQKKVNEQCKQMEPKVRPQFTICEVGGKQVVSAEIPSVDLAERPCFYGGKGRHKGSYQRVGESDEPMTDYEIYSFEAFRKKYQDDIRSVGNARKESLDPVLVRNYLERIKQDKPNLAKLDDDRILGLMNMVKDGEVTLVAEWLFGLYPQSFAPQLCVIATVVPGIEIGELGAEGQRFTANKRIEGTIPQMFEESLAFIKKNMNYQTKIDRVTGERTDIPEYPTLAVREILLNALIHRDYSIHTEGMPIQITMYSDRLEVSNPGGLYGRLRVDQLGMVQPDTRNPVLAVAMEILDMTENRYSGIPTIKNSLREVGLPEPEFIDTRNEFKIIVRNRKPADDGKMKMAGSYEKLLDYCSEPRTRTEISAFLGLSSISYAIRQHINPLIDAGLIELTIPDKPKSKNQRYKTTLQG